MTTMGTCECGYGLRYVRCVRQGDGSRIHPPLEWTRQYVKLTCCLVGDESIALCPLHAAAPEMVALLLEMVAEFAERNGGMLTDAGTRARALLAKIDAR